MYFIDNQYFLMGIGPGLLQNGLALFKLLIKHVLKPTQTRTSEKKHAQIFVRACARFACLCVFVRLRASLCVLWHLLNPE